MSDTCDGNCKGKWYSFIPDDRSIIRCNWCGKPCPAPLPPMPPEVWRLVEITQEYHNNAPSILPASECRICQAIAAVKSIFRSDP